VWRFYQRISAPPVVNVVEKLPVAPSHSGEAKEMGEMGTGTYLTFQKPPDFTLVIEPAGMP
jgi:hypothetical protein